MSWALYDHVDHAMLQQIFRSLEAIGKLFPQRLLDHPLAGKADFAPGSAMWISPSIA